LAADRYNPVESDAIEYHPPCCRPEFPGVVLRSVHVHVPALFFPDHMEPSLPVESYTTATTFEPVESDAIEFQAFPVREEFPGVVLRSIQVHVPALFVPDHMEPPFRQATIFEPVESDAIEFQDCPDREEFPDVVLRSIQVHAPVLLLPDHIEPFTVLPDIDPFIEQAITFKPVESDAIENQGCSFREEFPDVVLRSVHVHTPALLIPDHIL